jgi:hypothetical protein
MGDRELIERARAYVTAPFPDEPYEPGQLRVGRHMMREMIAALADRLEAVTQDHQSVVLLEQFLSPIRAPGSTRLIESLLPNSSLY